MKNDNQTDLTEGTIWKQILYFFFPILIGAFFQQLYNTVDAIVIGRFAGKEALTSVGGSSGQAIALLVNFFMALTGGCAVIISRFFGARQAKELKVAVETAYTFAIVGGAVVSVLGFLTAPLLLSAMNTPPELMAGSVLYMRVYYMGIIFMFIYNMGSSILRAAGDSKRPLYYLIVCCIINIILDLLFVAILKLGILGVALATLIAQAASAFLVTLNLMHQEELIRLDLKHLSMDMIQLSKMLYIGFPNGFQSVMYSLSNIVVQAAINNFGVNTMAAWTSLSKVDAIFWMMNGAIGTTCVTFSGQNYGAGRRDRISSGVRICLLYEILFSAVISTLFVTFGPQLFSVFTSDSLVVAEGVRMIRIISPFYAVFAFTEVLSAVMRAEGIVFIPTISVLLCICIMRILLVTVFGFNATIELTSVCYPITWVLSAIAMVLYYAHITGRQKKAAENV